LAVDGALAIGQYLQQVATALVPCGHERRRLPIGLAKHNQRRGDQAGASPPPSHRACRSNKVLTGGLELSLYSVYIESRLGSRSGAFPMQVLLIITFPIDCLLAVTRRV
jgi:hypothetical protein